MVGMSRSFVAMYLLRARRRQGMMRRFTVFWFNGTRSLGSTRAGEVLLWHPQDGRHNLRVIDDQGRAAEQLVRVRTIP